MLIPDRKIVEFLLKDVLRSRRIRSQAMLGKAIERRFREGNMTYSISAQRARMIAMETPGIRVSVRTRKGNPPTECPACGRKLVRMYARNLKGRKALVGMRCSGCSYKGSGNRWAPGRYEFSLEDTGRDRTA